MISYKRTVIIALLVCPYLQAKQYNIPTDVLDQKTAKVLFNGTIAFDDTVDTTINQVEQTIVNTIRPPLSASNVCTRNLSIEQIEGIIDKNPSSICYTYILFYGKNAPANYVVSPSHFQEKFVKKFLEKTNRKLSVWVDCQ